MTTAPIITPKALADEIGVDAKSLRGYLRKEFTRPNEVKNTSWLITPEAAEAAKAHFAKQETPAQDTLLDYDDALEDAVEVLSHEGKGHGAEYTDWGLDEA